MTVKKTQFAPHSDRTIYQCIECNFNTHNKKDYNKHLLTAKHTKNEMVQKSLKSPIQIDTPQYICNHCEKKYSDRTGLWRHKKKCTYSNENTVVAISNNHISTSIVDKKEDMSDMKELIIALMTQNQDMQSPAYVKVIIYSNYVLYLEEYERMQWYFSISV